MADVERLAGKVAPTDSTVLITGESGTGKGMIARWIHEHSTRSKGAFLPVNCSAIPEQLLESEFFGHTKGAFTGADRAARALRRGRPRDALRRDRRAAAHMQTKLLSVIEEKTVRAIGSDQPRRVDTRIIAATNRDLAEMVKQGKFREDLYFRLAMFHLHLPRAASGAPTCRASSATPSPVSRGARAAAASSSIRPPKPRSSRPTGRATCASSRTC